MRILVVDDSAFMRRAITRMIDEAPDMEVVGTASDGLEAIAQVKALKPDAVTLDIEMPNLDGIGALGRIMSECPTPVLMCSSLTTEGSQEALKALAMGACDVIAKDASHVSIHIADMKDDLLAKLRAIGGSRKAIGTRSKSLRAPSPEVRIAKDSCEIVLIGSSTGGPPVLETVLKTLDRSMSRPIVIAQHMPELFTRAMAERLDALCDLHVQIGETGMELAPGNVYIALGGMQTRVVRSFSGHWALHVDAGPTDELYKPSVNVLFKSAAEAKGDACLAIILTGMGDDGREGAQALSAKGATILAQDEASSVVFGMPGAVTKAGLASANLSPQEIGSTLRRLCVRGSDALRAAG